MFGISFRASPTEDAIKGYVTDAVEGALGKVRDDLTDRRKVDELQKEIAKLTIDRDRKVEEFSRKEREIEHKVGLERKRQEFEIDQAKRTTQVTVREENLAADKSRFAAEMDFQRKHLEGEIGSLRELVAGMLKRLPSAEIYAQIGGQKE